MTILLFEKYLNTDDFNKHIEIELIDAMPRDDYPPRGSKIPVYYRPAGTDRYLVGSLSAQEVAEAIFPQERKP